MGTEQDKATGRAMRDKLQASHEHNAAIRAERDAARAERDALRAALERIALDGTEAEPGPSDSAYDAGYCAGTVDGLRMAAAAARAALGGKGEA